MVRENRDKIRSLTDEDLRRVRVVNMGLRYILRFTHMQEGLPDRMDFPRLRLPDDAQILRVFLSEGGLHISFVIHSATFAPIPDDEEIPLLRGDCSVMWEVFELQRPTVLPGGSVEVVVE